ncbi:MAG TPA: tRNA (guanosine(37)-N1)-methyltransferase TrmD [Burkholderiaceae bacterium]|nr:tRNA (guanosine(37)-N1)-methyltransferase TrmD [Burkholderiaceae bacterium]
MRFDAITLFPEMFEAVTRHGITRRALAQGLWQFATINPRDFTAGAHRTVDDRPFGGGPGMVMMAEPLAQAVESARTAQRAAGCNSTHVIALTPSGTPLTDTRVRELAAQADLGIVLVCGRYEGIDQRFLDACVDEQVSLGDFVVSGGEVAAMTLIDAIVRQLPGALKEESAADESFADGLLDGPHYTRPEEWRGRGVPEVLLSGHHAEIARWRRAQRMAVTARVRPDLIERMRKDVQASRGNAQGATPVQSVASAEVPSSGAAKETPAGVKAARATAAGQKSRTTMA